MTIRGRWWIPNSPDDKQRGTFILDAEECALVLDQSFAMLPTPEPDPSGVVAYDSIFKTVLEPIVHGLDDEGQAYSLLDCSTHRPAITGEVTNTRNGVYAALIGAHLTTESLAFDQVRITFSHFLDWTTWLGLQVARTANDAEVLFELRAGTKRHRSYRLPDATVHVEERRRYKQDVRHFSVEQEAQFTVDLSSPEDWLQIAQKYITPLNDLLSLAMLAPSAFEEVMVHVPGDRPDFVHRLMFRSVHMRRKAPTQRLHPMDMLFTLNDTPTSDDLVASWFRLHKSQKHVIQQLLASQYAPFEWAENTFLEICRAADAFSRSKFKEQPHTQNQIDGLVKVLGQVNDSELLDYAIRVIKGGNHLSQQDQLRRLLSHSGPVGTDVLSAMPHFVKVVSDIRNGITHPSSKGNPGAVYRHRIEQAVRWVIRACLLKELGFDDARIRELVDRNTSYPFDIGELVNLETLRRNPAVIT